MPIGAPGIAKRHGLCIGGTGGPEYRALANIKDRCLNPKTKNYHRYGGRGIRICERWLYGDGNLTGIECFIDDLGPRPSPDHSVERIWNDGDYEPGNCRWATPKEQANNTRRNRIIEFDGKTYTLAQLASRFGMPYARLHARIVKLGWPLERALKEARYGVSTE